MKTYCVATAIIQEDNKYFIAKRAKTKKIAPDLWEFVTGFVEDHEAAEDTILREMIEEIGSRGTIVQELNVIQMNKNDERWIVLPFLVHVSSVDIRTKPEEHSVGEWVTWEELDRLSADEFRYDLNLLSQVLGQKQLA